MNQKTIHILADLHKKLKLEALKLNLPLRQLVEARLKMPVSADDLKAMAAIIK